MTSTIAALRQLIDSYGSDAVAHVATSTLFLAAAMAAVLLFRNRLTASARFAILFAGILKFAIPAAALDPLAALLPDRDSPARLNAIEAPLALLADAVRLDLTTSVSRGALTAVGTWAAVAAALLMITEVRRHRLVVLALRTLQPAAAREVEALGRARRRVGVRRAIDIARSGLPEAPAVLRVIRPVVLLPPGTCDDLTDAELESLLIHECAHVRRHDNLLTGVEAVICAIFWFHPLVWIAQRMSAFEREQACDEAVAVSPEDRGTYRAALAKFCHAAIAPRQPGVSCMATVRLKERIDHVMNYPALQAKSPSPLRVAIISATALVLFTLLSAAIGSDRLLAGTTSAQQPYAIKLTAEKRGEAISLRAQVSDLATRRVVAEPMLTFSPGERAQATTSASGREVHVDVRPGAKDLVAVEVTVRRDGKVEQTSKFDVSPAATDAATASQYSGQPISLQLKDAELRDLLTMFGRLTNLDIRVDPDVQGKVSVTWVNVPWDEAFDTILKDNGLTYSIEGSVINVRKR